MLHFRPTILHIGNSEIKYGFHLYCSDISIFDYECLHTISKKLFDPSQLMISMQKKADRFL